MIRILLLTILLTAAAAVPRLVAQPGPALTLDEAIAAATETSRRLAELRARGEAAEAVVRGRRAAGGPSIAASAGYTRTNHVEEFGVPLPDGRFRLIYPDIPDNVHTRLSFAWPIYTGGRVDALERAARAEAAAIGSEVAAARADLRLEVVRSYWGLATASEAVRVLDAALARADAHLSAVRVRLETGLAPPNEVSSAEAQRSRQQMLLIEARNTREAAAIALRRLVGAAPDAPMGLADPLDEATGAPPPHDPADLAAIAIQRRPELQALARRVEGAERRRDAAAAATRPTIAVAGGVDYANPNPRIFPREDLWRESWDVGINVAWTLWDAGRAAAERAEAAAGLAAVRARLADLQEEVSAEVRTRLLEVDSARAAVPAANDAVRAAAEARRVVTERFDVGVAASTDVLDAEAALLQAELDRARALSNLRLAEARLDRALGR